MTPSTVGLQNSSHGEMIKRSPLRQAHATIEAIGTASAEAIGTAIGTACAVGIACTVGTTA